MVVWSILIVMSLILCWRFYNNKKKRIIFGCIVPVAITIIWVIAFYIIYVNEV